MKRIFLAAAVIFSSNIYAQTDTTKNLETVVVTANKIEQKQNETGKVITVISRSVLEQNRGRSVGELLNEQVGMIIGGANNNYGTNQTVYVRGASSANTLVLLDGVPLNDASGVTSEFDLNTFALDQIERIEILKGAQSTLYGSDAVAGVINFISRKIEKGVQADGQLSAGSFGTIRAGIGVRGQKNGWQYSAAYSLLSSNGFSSAQDTSGTSGYEKDSFKQQVVQFGIGYTKFKNLELRAFGKYNFNKADIDAGAYRDDKDYAYNTKNFIAGLQSKYIFKKSYLMLMYNYNQYDRSYKDDSLDVAGVPYSLSDPYSFIYQDGKYYGRSHYAELFGNFKINSKINLVTGIDYRQNNTSQTYEYVIKDLGDFSSLPLNRDTASTNQYSIYGSFLYNDQKHFSIGIGGRFNHHSVYGNVYTYSVNPAYLLGKYKIFANVSSAYRVPSLYQLFSEYGNKNLKPESSVNYEAGIQYQSKKVNARIVAFKRDIKDVFAFYTDYTTYISNYINYDRQKDHGVEFELTVKPVKALTVSVNYAYTYGHLETVTDAGKDSSFYNLYRRPRHILNARVAYQATEKFLLAVSSRMVSSFYEPQYLADALKVNGYTVFNAYVSYNLKKQIRLFADLQNITDVKYTDQPGFNTRRFNIHGGLVFNL